MYNFIDQMRIAGVKIARKCRKLKMGAIAYSPSYSAARTKIELWNRVVKKLRGGKVDTRYLTRKAKKAGIDTPWDRTLQEALDCRSTAYRNVKWLAKGGGNR